MRTTVKFDVVGSESLDKGNLVDSIRIYLRDSMGGALDNVSYNDSWTGPLFLSGPIPEYSLSTDTYFKYMPEVKVSEEIVLKPKKLKTVHVLRYIVSYAGARVLVTEDRALAERRYSGLLSVTQRLAKMGINQVTSMNTELITTQR